MFFLICISYWTYEQIFIYHYGYGLVNDIVAYFAAFLIISFLLWFTIKNFGMFVEKIHVQDERITIYTYRKREFSFNELTKVEIEYRREEI